MSTSTRIVIAVLTAPLLCAAAAVAQPLGVYRWQLQPSCNVLQLSVFQQGSAFVLQGFDDHCGAAPRTAVIGSAFVTPDGTITIGLTTALAAGGAAIRIDASVHPASLSGPWRDSIGNGGGFVYTPTAGIAGTRRDGALNGIAPRSVTFDQLASEVTLAIPPRERFDFRSDGSFIASEIDVVQQRVTGFSWSMDTTTMHAATFDAATGGRSQGQNGPAGSSRYAWRGGLNPTGLGDYSLAFGDHASADGNRSIALGGDALARGDASVALGSLVAACGDGSVALGEYALTSSDPEVMGNLSDMCAGVDFKHAFVFSDGSSLTYANSTLFPAGGDNTFLARATGGIRFLAASGDVGCGMSAGGTTWACSSDRHLKTQFAPLDGEDVLRKLAAMPVDSWSFTAEPGVRHAGPMAQDFRAAFGLGSDDTSIGYTDINGINMRAIQALDARTREIAELKARLATLEAFVARLAERSR